MRNLDGHSARRLLMVGLATVVICWGLWNAIVGPSWTVVSEDVGTTTVAIPDQRGWIFVCCGLLTLLGAPSRLRLFRWFGLALTAVQAFLAVFSIGGVMVPVSVMALLVQAVDERA